MDRVSGFLLTSFLTTFLFSNTVTGYTSSAAIGLRDQLLHNTSGASDVRIHSRVLGNVIYLMASMVTTSAHLRNVEEAFMEKLRASM